MKKTLTVLSFFVVLVALASCASTGSAKDGVDFRSEITSGLVRVFVNPVNVKVYRGDFVASDYSNSVPIDLDTGVAIVPAGELITFVAEIGDKSVVREWKGLDEKFEFNEKVTVKANRNMDVDAFLVLGHDVTVKFDGNPGDSGFKAEVDGKRVFLSQTSKTGTFRVPSNSVVKISVATAAGKKVIKWENAKLEKKETINVALTDRIKDNLTVTISVVDK